MCFCVRFRPCTEGAERPHLLFSPGPGKLRNLIAIAIAEVKSGGQVRIAIAIFKLEVGVKIAIAIG